MCKRILTIAAIVLAVSGLALANTADVTQDGTDNAATVTQTGTNNGAAVNQYGKNLADIQQTGSTNTAQIDQGASGSPVTNFHLPAYPSDWWMGAYIVQSGNGNLATMNQKNSSTYSHIKQDGDGNKGTQDLGASISQANGTYSPHRGVQIDQVGNNNEAYQTTQSHFGCYGIQDMQIEQTGNSNYAKQDSVGGMASTMEIFQEGDDNSSTQYQNGRWSTAHVDILGSNNTTDQYQQYTSYGNSGQNEAYIDIVGSDNTANQSQTGEENNADIDISGNNNTACQTQDGSNNTAVIQQTGDNNGSDCSECDICVGCCNQCQKGSLNKAYAYVNGDENNTCQCQNGNGNYAYINIIGDLNTAQQCQAGDLNNAEIYQTGDSNVACQCQNGGDNSVITQTGGSNYACVNQGPCACP